VETHRVFIKMALRGVDVEDVLSRLSNADQRILFSMQSIQKPTDYEFKEFAQGLIKKIYKEHGALINLINSNFSRSILLERIKAIPVLDIEISADLKQMKDSSGINTITTYDQKLLWPCNCRVPQEYRNTTIRCPIHGENSGKIIENLFY